MCCKNGGLGKQNKENEEDFDVAVWSFSSMKETMPRKKLSKLSYFQIFDWQAITATFLSCNKDLMEVGSSKSFD